jgi:hypothetical protein
MSLITCPECAHEVSATAAACPNCGHMFAPPVVHRKVVVAEAVPERDDFPKWIFIPLGLLGALLLFVLFAYMRNDENADARNINVSVNTQRPSGAPLSNSSTTTTSIPSESSTVVVPPSTTTVAPPMTSSAPQTIAPPSTTTSIPGSSVTAPAPDKGTVTLDAKIMTSAGGVQPVKAERFYLLDKDLESILSEAGIDDETGQGLTNAYGLSVLYPDKYGDTKQRALSAINKHIVYRTQTDASGKASMKDVNPGSYYFFGITKTKTGFAVWNSPVSINAGQNPLNLSPPRLTEISQ